jgi:hypothetical protein
MPVAEIVQRMWDFLPTQVDPTEGLRNEQIR